MISRNIICRLTRLIVSVTVAMSPFAVAHAQSYPNKPVRIIVPFPAGGIVDAVTRTVSEKIAVNWGYPVVVDPRPGGNSIPATELAARSAADGYTLLTASTNHTVNPSLHRGLSYDAARDFAAIGMMAVVPNVVVVPASLAVSSMKEFVEYARARPGQLNYAHPGSGTTNHLSGELLKRVTGIELVAIPYKGQPQALIDVVSGQVAIMYATPLLVAPHIQAGRIKPLAVTSNTRLNQFPHVPTLSETGFKDTLVAPWFGIVGRAGTPKDVLNRLNAEINKALASPDVIARLEKMAAQPAASTPEEFERHLNVEMARWSALVKAANLKAD